MVLGIEDGAGCLFVDTWLRGLQGIKQKKRIFINPLIDLFFFSGKLSVIDGISQDNNTCHVRFFVDRIMHFLYTSEAVNKFVIKLHCIIELLNFQKSVCIYFRKG